MANFHSTGVTGMTRQQNEKLLTLNYSRLTAVLWGVCKKLQSRVEALEKKRKRKPKDTEELMASDEAALQLLGQLANDFDVRDARNSISWPGVTQSRARVVLQKDVARQVLAPKPRSQGECRREARPASGGSHRLQNTRSRNKLIVTDVFTREAATKALPSKDATTVARAAAEAIPDLVQEAGAFRAPLDARRSFEPRYGAAKELRTRTRVAPRLMMACGVDPKLPSLSSSRTRVDPRRPAPHNWATLLPDKRCLGPAQHHMKSGVHDALVSSCKQVA